MIAHRKKTGKALEVSATVTERQKKLLSIKEYAPLARSPHQAGSRVICNASNTLVYRTGDGDTLPVMRPGAERTHALPSRGIGA